MAQTKDGAVKLSANNYGLSVVDYLDKIKTENYCNKCKKWKPKNIFCIDRSRATGLLIKGSLLAQNVELKK
jgi:hypothetical protein